MKKAEAYHNQMVKTSVPKLIIRLGIPTTISMLIVSIYNLVDTYFVGTLGVSQQGATGILFTLQSILQAIAFLLGHGSGTYIAKCLAQKDGKKASNYACGAIYLGLAGGLLLLLFGLLFLTPFMRLLGSSETILPYAKEYGMWVLISAPFLIVSLVLNNILRYEGKALFAMIGMATGSILNILGDYIFITLMGMGVFGAGLSTAISQAISLILLIVFYLLFAQTSFHPKYLSFSPRLYWEICKAGFPSLLRQGLASISGGILNNLTKPFGDAAVAAISVVNRYSNLLMCVGIGIGQGLQPVAAYNYSCEEYGRMRKGVFFTSAFATGVVATISIVTLFIPSQIVSAFNANAEVIALGTPALRYAAIALIVLPISNVTNMSLQAVRKAFLASLLSALRNGLTFIPVIYILVMGMGLGFEGIALSQPIADGLTVLISLPFLILFLVELNRKEKAKTLQKADIPNENGD